MSEIGSLTSVRRRSRRRSLNWSLNCGFDGVDLVALVLEQAGHDLLQSPLPVAEPEAAGGRHSVELLVGQLGQQTEGIPRSR
jgi:hypothetical protein